MDNTLLIFIIIAAGIFGIIIGSFINVVVYRIHRGQSLGGRSKCTHCHKVIPIKYLIPVFGYFLTRCRCCFCCKRISVRYVIGETLLGVLFAGIAGYIVHSYGLSVASFVMIGYWIIMTSLLYTVSYYDMLHRAILTIPVIISAAVTLVYIMVIHYLFPGYDAGMVASFGQLMLGLLVPLPFFILWIVSRGTWIGFGDIEIMALIGIMFGLAQGIGAVMLGFWIATIIIGCWWGIQKIVRLFDPTQFTRGLVGVHIPFGPFLCAALVFVGVTQINIMISLQNALMWLMR